LTQDAAPVKKDDGCRQIRANECFPAWLSVAPATAIPGPQYRRKPVVPQKRKRNESTNLLEKKQPGDMIYWKRTEREATVMRMTTFRRVRHDPQPSSGSDGAGKRLAFYKGENHAVF